jgi:hypothetical protein
MSTARRIRLPRSPRIAEPVTTAEPPLLTQDDFGRWSLGWSDDAVGDFPTRRFARDYWLSSRMTFAPGFAKDD